jgi:hypothetical protein
MLKEALEDLSDTQSELNDSNLGDWKDDNQNIHMMVVNKKNAHKIDIARSLDKLTYCDPLFDGM